MNADEYRIFAQSHPFLSSAPVEPSGITLNESQATTREDPVQEKINRMGLQDELENVQNVYNGPNGTLKFIWVENGEHTVTFSSAEEFNQIPDWDIVEKGNDEYFAIPTEFLFECNDCQSRYHIQDAEYTEDDDRVCRNCARNYNRCANCGRLAQDVSWAEYQNGDSYGEICETCQNADFYWDDERECYVKRSSNMSFNMYLKPNGILANGGRMPRCSECAETEGGCCPRHLKQKMKEIEEEQTTLWIYDTERRNYHESGHKRFKETKYRLQHEHPFLYYGAELEWLFNLSQNKRAEAVKAIIEASGGLFVSEYDRSVDDLGTGAEFITRPMSYKAWCSDTVRDNFKKVEEVAKKYKIYNPQPIGCGLHVHMSKRFFEENTTKKVNDIKNDIDWMFQYYQPEFEKISKRKYTRYCTSKSMRAKDALNQISSMSNIKGSLSIEKGGLMVSMGSGETHHECINESKRTIEARTFLSMTTYEDVMAIIEFCRAIAHASRNNKSLANVPLSDILYSKDSKYLPGYLKNIRDLDLTRKFKNKLEVKI